MPTETKTEVVPVLTKRYELKDCDPEYQPDFSQFEDEMNNWKFYEIDIWPTDGENGFTRQELRAEWVGGPREPGEELELCWNGRSEYYWGVVREQE